MKKKLSLRKPLGSSFTLDKIRHRIDFTKSDWLLVEDWNLVYSGQNLKTVW